MKREISLPAWKLVAATIAEVMAGRAVTTIAAGMAAKDWGMRVPVVNGLACELDVWDVAIDGTLYFEVHDQGPPHGKVKGQVLIKRRVGPDKWHWEDR